MLERKWLRFRYRINCIVGRQPKRVAFLHIPKCGGTTVFQHFKTNIGGGRSGRIAQCDSLSFAKLDAKALERSRRARFVSGHFGWTALSAAGADAFRFTVLREPFDRLVSLYKFSRTKQHSDNPIFSAVFEAAKQRSFGDFSKVCSFLTRNALISSKYCRTTLSICPPEEIVSSTPSRNKSCPLIFIFLC